MKKKLRDLTLEEYMKAGNKFCKRYTCNECMFNLVNCGCTSKACWIYHKDIYSDKFLDQEIEIEIEDEKTKPQLTELEKGILKNHEGIRNQEYNYIARDENGSLFLFPDKPKKTKYEFFSSIHNKYFPFNNLFKFIKWEDEEPTLIKDLLKED